MVKYLPAYLIIINLFGFAEMYIDKKRSIKKQWRTPEAKFFFIALVLGSPGVLIGMYTFRHKTKHIKFTFGIPLIIIIQVGLWFYFSRS